MQKIAPYRLEDKIMKNKIYIEMGKFIEQYNDIKNDAIFSLKIRDSLKKDLKNLSNTYNLILFMLKYNG